VLLGLVLAYGGGWSMVLLRRLTMQVVRRAAPALDRGEPGVAVRVHLFGLAADVVRSGSSLVSVSPALALRSAPHSTSHRRALALVTVAGGFLALIGGRFAGGHAPPHGVASRRVGLGAMASRSDDRPFSRAAPLVAVQAS